MFVTDEPKEPAWQLAGAPDCAGQYFPTPQGAAVALVDRAAQK